MLCALSSSCDDSACVVVGVNIIKLGVGATTMAMQSMGIVMRSPDIADLMKSLQDACFRLGMINFSSFLWVG